MNPTAARHASLRRSGLASLVLLLYGAGSRAEEKTPLIQAGQRIVFLGDSITHAGHYTSDLEARLRATFSKREPAAAAPRCLNLGLPSETVSGLSEPDHPFPRPDLHERLDRVLDKTKPDLVVAGYGVNDGIYYPFDAKRFDAYKKGVGKLIEKVHASGAKLVLLTPPPFDPLPMKRGGKLRPAGAEKYAWFAIYAKYDEEVMAKYAAWILQQEKRVARVVDLRSPILAHVASRRKKNPGYVLSGDGIHLNAVGHGLIADAVGRALGIPQVETKSAGQAKEVRKLLETRMVILRDAWLTHVGHKRPGVRKGLRVDEARKRAEEIDTKLRKLGD